MCLVISNIKYEKDGESRALFERRAVTLRNWGRLSVKKSKGLN